jgi:hypothetical protein
MFYRKERKGRKEDFFFVFYAFQPKADPSNVLWRTLWLTISSFFAVNP